MNNTAIGILTIILAIHVCLIMACILNTLQSSISVASKIAWCMFLILLPFIGYAVFRFRFQASSFQGKPYEPKSEDLGSPPSGFSRDDKK